MSANYIQLYDDNVVKFSIRQGVEDDRWSLKNNYTITASDNNKTYITYTSDNTSIIKPTNEMVGSFTIGELVCTRDTNRVFLGNFSDKLQNTQQQTLGGTLVGNKYLGYIDSKPLITASKNGIPESLSSSNSSLLLKGSRYRSYHHTENNSTTCKLTEDQNWCKQSYYNEKYDAYDGDYMYDIFRNALIIFDHNIKPSNSSYNASLGEEVINSGEAITEKSSPNNRRRTPLIPYAKSKENNDETVYKHTQDMYGDGYVLLYNVIPDGHTLTFVERAYDTASGKSKSTEYKGNYSQNIIKINKIPVDLIDDHFDTNYFNTSGSKITLNIGALQTQISAGNLNLDSGALKNVYKAPITANTVVITDDNGFLATNSGINSSYLTGLKGNIQSQINALAGVTDTAAYATQDDLDLLEARVKVLEDGSSDSNNNSMVNFYFNTTYAPSNYENAKSDGSYAGDKSAIILTTSTVNIPNTNLNNDFGYTIGNTTCYRLRPNKSGTLIISAYSKGTGFRCLIGLITTATDPATNTTSTHYKHLALIDPQDAIGEDTGGCTTCLPVTKGKTYALIAQANTLGSAYSMVLV